tara:strand:- start:1390 stop:2004 length:615 start_codon:yes stop_codon:yes gene_type:complete
MSKKYQKGSTPYRVLKLQSGEELITKIGGKKADKIILDNPMIIKSSTQSDMFGRTKEIFFLRKWICGTSSNIIKIPESFIISWNSPSKEVSYMYSMEEEHEKMEKNKEVNPIKNMPSHLQALLDELEKTKDKSDFVFMNMALPPELAKELFEDGLLDMNDDDQILDFDEEDINDHLYTGEDTSDPNYGNRWTDWNPDPLGDEYN